jgi:hypothetical protein
MNSNDTFYLCPICFEVSESQRAHHGRLMLQCNPGQPGDERRKPVISGDGRLHSHAPRWFLEAIGALPNRPTHRAARSTVHV